MKRCLVTVLYLMVSHNILVAKELTLDDVFLADRVLDVQITIDEKDWDTIRFGINLEIFSRLCKRAENMVLLTVPIPMLKLV